MPFLIESLGLVYFKTSLLFIIIIMDLFHDQTIHLCLINNMTLPMKYSGKISNLDKTHSIIISSVGH